MVKLFKYEDYTVKVDPEAILLKPFKAIYDRDKSKDKNKAMQELGFIYFMCDPRSDYQYIVDPIARQEEIIKGEGMRVDWKPDKKVEDAMSFYSSFKPSSALLLEDTRYAIDKLRMLLRNIDLEARDDKDRPIYTLQSFTATIKQIPDLIERLDAAEKTLTKDIVSSQKIRGSQEKSIYEDL